MIIAIAGVKGAGKDTAAEVLEDFTLLKMAGGLKAMTRAFLEYQHVDADTIERMVEGDFKEITTPLLGGKSPREFMQLLGSEFGRDMINKNLWVDSTMAKAQHHENVKLTDIRFHNEHSAVVAAGGYTIRVERATERNQYSLHQSELEIPELPVDAVIDNSGTIDELHTAVKTLVVDFKHADGVFR